MADWLLRIEWRQWQSNNPNNLTVRQFSWESISARRFSFSLLITCSTTSFAVRGRTDNARSPASPEAHNGEAHQDDPSLAHPPRPPRPRQNAHSGRFQSRSASAMTWAMSPNGRDKVVEFDHFGVTKSPRVISTTMCYAMRMVGKWPQMKAEKKCPLDAEQRSW